MTAGMATTQNLEAEQHAVIYCRVSSKKQTVEGSGLESQEHRCRRYAEERGYAVEAVFPDDVSGGGDFMNRPGMVALLSYLSAQRGKDYVVIFDDLKRFARDTEFHLKLRRELQSRNARVECLNFKIEDTPEGKFVETIMAAQGELEREQNGRQVRQKMRARVEAGYWTFHAPAGYRYATVKGQGKILVRDEPLASVIAEAFEGYATGRFDSQAEVKRFLEAQPGFPGKQANGELRNWRVTKLLRNPIYAGLIEVPKWQIPRFKGAHEGLVSMQTFQRVQERMAETANAPARKDINADFPLRGHVACASCGKPLRGCWSRSKTGTRHPYYLCQTKGCADYGKSIRRAEIENGFEDILKDMTPGESLVSLMRSLLRKAWTQRLAQSAQIAGSVRCELARLETQIDALLDRIVEATTTRVVSVYETKIARLETEKAILAEKLAQSSQPRHSFDDMLELSLRFLANPWKLWASGNLTLQRTVLKLAFGERLTYCRNEGYRTPKTTLPFRVLAGISSQQEIMVR